MASPPLPASASVTSGGPVAGTVFVVLSPHQSPGGARSSPGFPSTGSPPAAIGRDNHGPLAITGLNLAQVLIVVLVLLALGLAVVASVRSPHGGAAVDADDLPVDPLGVGRQQECHHGGDVSRPAQAGAARPLQGHVPE